MPSPLRTGFSSGSFRGYLAVPDRPVSQWKGAVIVIHEVWGLVELITNVADRFAAEGFLALAPDLMGEHAIDPAVGAGLQWRLTSPDLDEQRAAQARLAELAAPVTQPSFAVAALTRLVECIDFLAAQKGVDGRIGVTGFSFGGSYAVTLAVVDSRIRASVPFYGAVALPSAVLADLACPVLYVVGEDDEVLMDALPALTETMRHSGVSFTPYTLSRAGHGFFDDSNNRAYRKEAATDSWVKCLDFFEEALSSPN
ncbi:dienelactone hydrolase family protein [Subtercola lobariae]|uniref:Dienelactone hydrolase domain-containing protein n=1 Tax=Subtercola lobariae TaxID=1588641 RepID=A0A917B3K9_9MICO|nr:dienelactone hydrolase family protein [Subtercola lobariae]GGF17303.1 hypothetical protein GCM10011399_08820 [Subtercola lobariae]